MDPRSPHQRDGANLGERPNSSFNGCGEEIGLRSDEVVIDLMTLF